MYCGRYDKQYLIHRGDLLIGMDGDFLVEKWRGDEALLNQRVCKLVAKPSGRIDQAYLYYLLEPEIEAIHRRTPQTTVRHLSTKAIKGIIVRVPDLPEQQRIAEILDTLDEAIRKTEGVIAKLRQMKQGLLHDLLTRGLDDNGELRDPDRHPEQFHMTPLGRLPKGWSVARMHELTSKIVDGVHHTPTYTDVGVPFVTVENLTRGGGISLTPCRYVSARAHAEYKRRAEPRAGDVLVSKDGTLGVARLVPEAFPEVSIFVSVALLRPLQDRVLPFWIRQFFDTWHFVKQLSTQSAGTGLKHIHLEHFREFILPLPQLAEQQRLVDAVGHQSRRIEVEEAELAKLRDLKSGLMNDLLTGRVRVTKLIEKAA